MDNLTIGIDPNLLTPCMFFIGTVKEFTAWVNANRKHFDGTSGVEQYGYINDNFVVVDRDVFNEYMADTYGEEPSDQVFECWWHHGVLRNNRDDTACDEREINDERVMSFKVWIKCS